MKRCMCVLLLAGALALAPDFASSQVQLEKEQEQQEPAERGKAETEKEAPPPEAPGKKASVPEVYVPPSRGTARVRVGASTRGEQPQLPALEALAPDHVAFTTRAQPMLLWYLSEETGDRIDLVLIDDSSVEPLLETTLQGKLTPGIHALDLSRHGVRLEPGRVYQWFVALIPDPERRSRDVIAGGAIQRVEAGPELQSALAQAPSGQGWMAYAQFGVWYDALSGISGQIRKNPSNRELRSLRARLLADGQLPAAAAWERAAAGGGA